MKTTLSISSRAAAVVLAAATLVGCRSDATSPPPQAHGVPAATPAPEPAPAIEETPALASSPEPVLATPETVGTAPAVPRETAPETPALSPGVAEVVQMARAQVGEQVLLDYVQDSPVAYDMTSAEIVYLKDVGVSEGVIQAMMHRGQELRASEALAQEAQAQSEAVATAAPSEAPPESALVTSPPPPAQIYDTPVAAPAPAPAAVTNNYFYDSLSPYGSWVEVADYGWCWRPTCAVVNTGWRPYYDNGSWVYSDSGWYWNSYYSWGWAPFHYGRWCSSPRWGWVWSPGHVWGPAWVTWRYTDAYYGWAPLPPACGWSTGIGLTWHGSGTSVGFGFGLTSSSYCFVPQQSFCHPHLYRYGVGAHQVAGIYQNSTVINNVIIGNNNTIINQGIAPERLPSSTRAELRRVTLQDVSPERGKPLNPGQIDERRSELAVYRPNVPARLSRPTKGDDHYDPPYHATSRTTSWEAPKSATPTTRTLGAAPVRSDRTSSRAGSAPARSPVGISTSTSTTRNTPQRAQSGSIAPTRRQLTTPAPQPAPSSVNPSRVITRSLPDRGGMTVLPSSPPRTSAPRSTQPSGPVVAPRTPVQTTPRPSVTAPTRSTSRPIAPVQVMPGRSTSPGLPGTPARVSPTPSVPTRIPGSGSSSFRSAPIRSQPGMAVPSRLGGSSSSIYSRGSVSRPPVSRTPSFRSPAPSIRSVPRSAAPAAPSRSGSIRPMTSPSPRMSAPSVRTSPRSSPAVRSTPPAATPGGSRRP